ncbi:MFS transporter [Streptomyces sp. CMSTAAHL-2]|uniref:MFS transporter n=1 Tax=Streptomyces sp. CMSTAAHL-2 TaxID=2904522 RepID=UPI001E41C8C3|nr:MFS transporter [Streptomyces sp. CMSTAAHL-2]MCE3033420.1 MFS transporter [Streptomyces sp. CMSTAAHL-2]
MSTSQASPHTAVLPAPAAKLPLSALLALAAAAFMAILTEALPAGVLPEMARGLSVGEAAAGQTLTVYALATGLSAIPVSLATATWRRKRLLLLAVLTITVANAVTALSSSYLLTMAFRLAAGVAAAVIWAELVGYARRLAPPRLVGRAIAITMGGVPLALSVGIPVGTFLGSAIGWRATFGLTALVCVLLLGWITVSVPDHPGRRPGRGASILGALRLPGVLPVLFVVAAYVLAHNILYTYISAFLGRHGMGGSRDLVLLVFGIASVVSILVTGALVDRRLRGLTVAGTALFLVAAVLLLVAAGNAFAVYGATVLWGLGWGGMGTLLQTAVTDAGGDRAQPLLVTTWNSSMAGGGAAGGLLLDTLGPGSFPWSALALLAPVLAVVLGARAHGFPVERPGRRASAS